jgi:hypothetical protein
MLRSTDDPEMDQELYTLGGMLHRSANNMITENRRQSWMDGSDCDDEDQHSWSFFWKNAEIQPESVSLIIII